MGMVFGKIDSEMPEHRVVYECEHFQVWKYSSSVAAVVEKVDLDPDNTLTERQYIGKSFRTLASYIGVFGESQNRSRKSTNSEKIAMTAPVVMTATDSAGGAGDTGGGTSEKIAMTAPVVMTGPSEEIGRGKKMAFLLPKKYAAVEDAPEPTNPAVKLELRPSRYEAVMSFSWFFPYTFADWEVKANQLREAMRKEEMEPTGPYSMCGYNPPFTLPLCRRNEVHFPVGENPKFNKI